MERLVSLIDGWSISWTGPSVRVSEFVRTGRSRTRTGFEFPYGDYQGIDLLGNRAVMAWGEGHNYVGGPTDPGHVINRSMRA